MKTEDVDYKTTPCMVKSKYVGVTPMGEGGTSAFRY